MFDTPIYYSRQSAKTLFVIPFSKMLFEKLDLNTELDYKTYPDFGNCGSASLPLTVALAAENSHFKKDDNVALLGIGSGINCTMLSLKW